MHSLKIAHALILSRHWRDYGTIGKSTFYETIAFCKMPKIPGFHERQILAEDDRNTDRIPGRKFDCQIVDKSPGAQRMSCAGCTR